MEPTAKALIDHWAWATKRGLMNANTAGTFRAACAKVLSIFDDLEAVDVSQLDVQDTVRRFKNLRGKDLKPDSIEAYGHRFRQALKSFLDYVNDPGTWKGPTRQPERNGRAKAKDSAAQHGTLAVVATGDLGDGRSIDYPLPLRDGFVAHLVLPTDLKINEIGRITKFINALVAEELPVAAG
jgi:hypothetical protein